MWREKDMGTKARGVTDQRSERLSILYKKAKKEFLAGKDWSDIEKQLKDMAITEWSVSYKTVNDYVATIDKRLGSDPECVNFVSGK